MDSCSVWVLRPDIIHMRSDSEIELEAADLSHLMLLEGTHAPLPLLVLLMVAKGHIMMPHF